MTSSAAVSSLWRPTSARKSCRLSAAPLTGSASYALAAAASGAAGLGLLGRLADLEPDRLELARQLLDLLLGEVVLQRERLELGGLDEPALLGALDQQARLIAFKQLGQLILRQVTLVVLSCPTASIPQTFSP